MSKIPCYFTAQLTDLQYSVDSVKEGRAVFYDTLDKKQKRDFDLWFNSWIKLPLDQIVSAAKGDERIMRGFKRGY